ncbi:MAG: tRNA (guanine(10)-N(2))-dimethyltransferase [Thermoplasmata archaeon]
MVRFDFEIEEVQEGKASILVPKAVRGKGPGRIEGIPFYNPVMETSRDISVLLVQKCIPREGYEILDGLAGTGIRGIRLALEVEGKLSITLNDWNEPSFELMRENIKRNDVQNAQARQEDLRRILSNEMFDYVDVDPYGTPAPFLKDALRGVRENGILAITATDTATLAGNYPNACLRRYRAKSLRGKGRHEIGLRILIGYCARLAAESQIGVRPLLSHSTDHYYRTYLRIERGQQSAVSCVSKVGYYSKNLLTQEIALSSTKKESSEVAGPLWIGNLWDSQLIQDIRPRSYMSHRTSKVVEMMRSESGIGSPFYSSDELASRLRVHTPPLSKILESLQSSGYAASRTHFDTKGFRTEAPIDRILELFKKT